MSKTLDRLITLEREARKFGFDWPDEAMILDQAISECQEIREAIHRGEPLYRVQEEIGDLLHTAISLCLFAEFEVDETVAIINKKFGDRMEAIKALAKSRGLENFHGQTTEFMMELWREAKRVDAFAPAGAFRTKDSEGYLCETPFMEALSATQREAVKRAAEEMARELGTCCHSIYLVGTERAEDLEWIILMRGSDVDGVMQEEWRLEAIDFNDLSDEVKIYPVELTAGQEGLTHLEASLRVNGVCVWGEPLNGESTGIPPSLGLVNAELLALEEEIARVRAGVPSGEEVCKRLMRCLLQGCFLLVAPLIEQYTSDVSVCAALGKLYFPSLKAAIEEAERLYYEPTNDPETISKSVHELGLPLCTEIQKWMSLHNSTRHAHLSKETVITVHERYYLPERFKRYLQRRVSERQMI